MDFQENRPSDTQETVSASQPSPSADNPPSAGTDGGSAHQNRPPYENGSGCSCPQEQPYENNGASLYQNGQPYQNRPPYGNGAPYPAPQPPYQNGTGSVQPPYGNNQGAPRQNPGGPYRNNVPYGGPSPDRNQNQYPGGYQNQYPGGYRSGSQYNQQNNYHNGYPYYGRNTYQLPASEPGSSFAKAAMICGSLSIVFGFVLPIYPTFTLACVAIVLALLSRGRQTKMFFHARIGIICAIVGLVLNMIVVVSSIVPVLTDPKAREEFNQSWEAIWGESFEDTMDDIMENNGY